MMPVTGETASGRRGDAPPAAAAPGSGFGVQINDAQYKKLAQLVYRLCGINLGSGKKELLRARLAKRLRATSSSDVRQYIQHLESDGTGSELVCFLDCITTNKTDFFREPQHFDFLARELLPQCHKLCQGREPLRVWSAASSTGEEPYTLAMVLMENRQHWRDRGIWLMASDLSTQVLDHGRQGVYAADRAATIPRPLLVKYFQRGQRRWTGYVRVRKGLRDMVEFRRLNLMDPFKFSDPLHIVFCRNVMIYFDKPTQEKLVQKFFDVLVPGGYLFVGHSESLTGIEHRFKFVRPAVYRKEA